VWPEAIAVLLQGYDQVWHDKAWPEAIAVLLQGHDQVLPEVQEGGVRAAQCMRAPV